MEHFSLCRSPCQDLRKTKSTKMASLPSGSSLSDDLCLPNHNCSKSMRSHFYSTPNYLPCQINCHSVYQNLHRAEQLLSSKEGGSLTIQVAISGAKLRAIHGNLIQCAMWKVSLLSGLAVMSAPWLDTDTWRVHASTKLDGLGQDIM